MSQSPPILPVKKSIVVLPFVNMSADPENEYFSDGITEEIINALTRVRGLKVIARTSSFAFKNRNIDVRTIGDQLGVSTILEGSVRKAQNKVRITVQLVSAEDGSHFWSKNFDRKLENIFALQDEVSLLIADQIRENFGHLTIQEHLIEESTPNIEAYNQYLKGRYEHLKWDGPGIVNAIKHYSHSVSTDPAFALPYFGLAFCYAMYGSWGNNRDFLQLSEENLKKGFDLDNQSCIGYFSKGTLSYWGYWDFDNAHKYFKKAVELNPSYTEAEECLCELYSALGEFEKALWHADNILNISPLSPNHYFTKANMHYLNEEYPKALECLETSLSINPNFAHSIALKQLCLILTRDYEELNDFLERTPLAERPNECRMLYKLVNPEDRIDVDISAANVMIKEDFGTALFPWQLFLLVHMDKHDMALDFLEENIKRRTGQIINFMNIPLIKPLHQYQRFKDLKEATFDKTFLQSEPESQKSTDTPKALMVVAEIDMVLETVEKGMNDEKWFKNPSLSLRELADMVNISSNKLSWLLNERVGQNFNEYINSLRLENFKEIALNPSYTHLTLLGMAYESGFNSKSVFNAFFKKVEGMTPKAWLRANQA